MFEPPDEIIDLTLPVEPGMAVWPGFPEVSVEQTAIRAVDGFTMDHLSMRSHTGTHVDAPMHFISEGKSLAAFDVSKFMGPGVVLDLAPCESAETITPERLEPFADDIEAGDVVFLHTGWDEHYGRTPEWLFEFPHLSGEASAWLADHDVKAVGIDTPSVGGWYDEAPNHGPSTDVSPAESHLPLLENDILPVEELCNLDAVLDGADTRRAFLVFPPLNLQDTSGSSVRAFAFL
jgi:kynurenine formamidase